MRESPALVHEADQALRAALCAFVANSSVEAVASEPSSGEELRRQALDAHGDEILQLLLELSEDDNMRQAHATAVWAANAIFPFENVGARKLCMMAAGDTYAVVRDEARRGLSPSAHATHYSNGRSSGADIGFPSLDAVLDVWRELAAASGAAQASAKSRSRGEAHAACVAFAHSALLDAARRSKARSLRAYSASKDAVAVSFI